MEAKFGDREFVIFHDPQGIDQLLMTNFHVFTKRVGDSDSQYKFYYSGTIYKIVNTKDHNLPFVPVRSKYIGDIPEEQLRPLESILKEKDKP